MVTGKGGSRSVSLRSALVVLLKTPGLREHRDGSRRPCKRPTEAICLMPVYTHTYIMSDGNSAF